MSIVRAAKTSLLHVWLQVLDRDSHIGSGSGKQDSGVRLHVALPKAEQHYWRSLFEGGPQRSHVEVSIKQNMCEGERVA